MQIHGTAKLPAQLICPVCHTTFISKASDKSETFHGQSHYSLTKATINDAQDLESLPDPYTKLPSLRSWATFRDSKSVVSKTHTNLDRSQMHPFSETRNNPNSPTPLTSNPLAARCGNIIQRPEPNQKVESRGTTRGPDISTFKIGTAKLLRGKDQDTHLRLKLTKIYRTMREMNRSKRPGEGRAMLEGIKTRHRESQEYKIKQQPLRIEHKFIEPRTPPQPPATTSVARPGSRHHPVPVDKKTEKSENVPTRHHSRKDSVVSDRRISLSSCDIPIGIDRKHVFPDLNKPLPPLPQPQPQPQPFPTTTFKPHHPPPIKPTATPKEPATHATLTSATIPTIHTPPPPQPLPPWIQHPQISHPAPLVTAHNLPTANIALECGGTGGLAAAVSLPFPRTPPQHYSQDALERLPCRRKGKHVARLDARFVSSSRRWRGKLGGFRERGRPDSDVSFMCRGVDVDVDGGGEGSRVDGERNTRFYQPVHDVLKEYHGWVI